jgi:hypothetical protein
MYTLPSHRCFGHGLRAPRPSPSTPSQSIGGHRRLQRANAESQSLRFQHEFDPSDARLPRDLWLSKESASQPGLQSFMVDKLPRRLPPDFWSRDQPGSAKVASPHAPLLRVGRASVPAGGGLPGAQFVWVEMERNYSAEWPSLSLAGGNIAVRPGFLAPVDDPGVIPFFFYRGLELLRFSWGERALQAAAVAAYALTHLVLLALLAEHNAPLALAVGLNWALGQLSLAKWALLLALASSGKLWMYYAFQVARLLDAGLARVFPPIRNFFWANFSVWALYVALSPSWAYPLPFWPFAPGSTGGAAAPLV